MGDAVVPAMAFSLSVPATNFYPPTLQPWEPTLTSAQLGEIVRRAEDVGFDALAVSDHLLMNTEMAALMGGHWCESMTAVSYLAGATTRARVYASVMVAPYRHPLLIAKQLSSLDFLSGGRAILGVGIGHLAKEFEVLGVPREKRGQMTDEYLAAIRALWTEESPSFSGEFVSFDDVVFEPRPDPGAIPIWVGGNSPAAIRRAARFGDGWVPWQITPADLPAALDQLFSHPEFAGEAEGFDVVMPGTIIQREEGTQRELGETVIPDGPDQWIDVVGANRDGGATMTSVGLTAPTYEGYLDKLSEFGERVIGAFA